MKRKNGSVMVITLLCCFILSCICLACIELIKTNNDIVCTHENATKLEYDVKGGINLGYSKILEEVNNVLVNNVLGSKDLEENIEDKFKDYFLGNNKINVIKSIEDLEVDDLKIFVVNNDIYLDDNYIKLDLECRKENKKIKKIARCSFKININLNEENKKRVYKYNYKEI
ncbi:hypothetical protein LZ906_012305 [Paraclostridium ghonii]|uniref:hypothetical protein n=1 Tax=Paraclostridium ghonii TaxID=29358 RepID=UPI00202CBFCB|nr:hypothetical protein [Paeniclostridium ghonii]MCM0165192.1 hypothetical protein [Paeniclostridium ghonii]